MYKFYGGYKKKSPKIPWGGRAAGGGGGMKYFISHLIDQYNNLYDQR